MESPRDESTPAQAAAPASESSFDLQRLENLAAILITAVILIFHLTFLGNAGALWRDEVGTIEFSRMGSVSEIWNSLQYDNHPPLTVFALRAWKVLSMTQTDFGYRIFGFLAGAFLLASIWISSWLVRRRAPFWVLLLFALHPLTITVGDSIRPYGLGIAFSVLTFGLVWKVVSEGSLRWLLLASFSAIASVQTLYHNSFIVLAICLGGFTVCMRQSRWRNFLKVGIVGFAAALSLIPYIWIIAKGRDYGIVSRSAVYVSGLVSEFGSSILLAGPGQTIAWICSGVLCAIGVVWLAIHRKGVSFLDEEGNYLTYLIVLCVLSSVFYVGFLMALHMWPQRWYFLLLQAFLALGIDSVLRLFLRNPILRLSQLGIGLLLLGVSVGPVWHSSHERRTNIDQAAEFLKKFATADDLIVVDPFFVGISFQYYYSGKAPWTMLPEVKDVKIHRFDLLKETMQLPHPLEPVLTRADETLRRGGQVWLLGMPKFLAPGIKPESLAPAPHSPYGWMLPGYLHYWSLEASAVLSSFSTNVNEIDFPSSASVNSDEKTKLYLFRGSKHKEN
jgi:hypothetical protein